MCYLDAFSPLLSLCFVSFCMCWWLVCCCFLSNVVCFSFSVLLSSRKVIEKTVSGLLFLTMTLRYLFLFPTYISFLLLQGLFAKIFLFCIGEVWLILFAVLCLCIFLNLRCIFISHIMNLIMWGFGKSRIL